MTTRAKSSAARGPRGSQGDKTTRRARREQERDGSLRFLTDVRNTSIWQADPATSETEVVDLHQQVIDLRLQVAASNDRFRSIVDRSPDGAIVVDGAGIVRFANRAAEAMLGRAESDVNGETLGFPVVAGDTAQIELLRPGGEIMHVEMRVVESEWGGEPASLALLRDMTERRRMEDELGYMAAHDPLTGLPNRFLLVDRVEHATARGSRSTNPIALLFLDLDDFKTINDSLGHACGDELLAAFAERLRLCCRPGDTAARLGGDEFAILLEGLSGTSDAVTVAERIGAALLAPFELQGKEVSIGSSIGIAMSTPGRGTAGALLRNADVAMYAAKSRGKGRYEIFQPSMHVAAFERLELKEDLQRAVERRELVLHYQPIVELETGRITGLEALVRWDHPPRGLMAPADFIPLAEETGLIHPLGRWVLNEACRQTRLWQARYPRRDPLQISVNLSAKQIHSETFSEEIVFALRRSGLVPSTLILEITESVLLDREVAMRRLAELSKIGVRVAIDDFGTGYSSLSYLNRFPIHILKVDQSFVRQIGHAPDQDILAQAVLDLTRTLGLEAVAEGIEQRKQKDRLQELGCKYGQGYWYFRPLDSAEIEELLAAEHASGTPLPAASSSGKSSAPSRNTSAP